mmetsp:Transcript_20053/g.48669  ORF Transcript_20053/g.48669 Transcript_20053/m.48669 type:complete len:229 (+) Transcript_20053:485-1171(+)
MERPQAASHPLEHRQPPLIRPLDAQMGQSGHLIQLLPAVLPPPLHHLHPLTRQDGPDEPRDTHRIAAGDLYAMCRALGGRVDGDLSDGGSGGLEQRDTDDTWVGLDQHADAAGAGKHLLPLFVYGWRATCETCRVVEEQNGMHFGVADDGRDRRADTREGLDALNEAQITTDAGAIAVAEPEHFGNALQTGLMLHTQDSIVSTVYRLRAVLCSQLCPQQRLYETELLC